MICTSLAPPGLVAPMATNSRVKHWPFRYLHRVKLGKTDWISLCARSRSNCSKHRLFDHGKTVFVQKVRLGLHFNMGQNFLKRIVLTSVFLWQSVRDDLWGGEIICHHRLERGRADHPLKAGAKLKNLTLNGQVWADNS